MPRVLTYGKYAVFVLSEIGERHHSPHAHIKHGGQRVASIFLVTLEVFNELERIPSGLLTLIRDHQDELLLRWQELNDG